MSLWIMWRTASHRVVLVSLQCSRLLSIELLFSRKLASRLGLGHRGANLDVRGSTVTHRQGFFAFSLPKCCEAPRRVPHRVLDIPMAKVGLQ
jgi:hypothetical protein